MRLGNTLTDDSFLNGIYLFNVFKYLTDDFKEDLGIGVSYEVVYIWLLDGVTLKSIFCWAVLKFKVKHLICKTLITKWILYPGLWKWLMNF